MSVAGGMPTQAGKVRLAVTACFVRSGHITSDRLGAQVEVLAANKRTTQIKASTAFEDFEGMFDHEELVRVQPRGG